MGLLINIDGQSKKPIFRQIMDQIVAFIDSEILRPGARLPSTRSMAEKLGVNRSTVYKAYQELWSLGYMESSPGSYSTVRNRPKVATKPREVGERWQERIMPISDGIMALPGSSHFYGAADGLYFRLSIAHLNEAEIEEGIRRMGQSFERLYQKGT